jgi:hypothetical protein
MGTGVLFMAEGALDELYIGRALLFLGFCWKKDGRCDWLL